MKKSKQFVMGITLSIVTFLLIVGATYTIKFEIEQIKESVLLNVFDESKTDLQIFHLVIENFKDLTVNDKDDYTVNVKNILEIVKGRIELHDDQFATNSFLLDSHFNIITKRAVEPPGYCNPFEDAADINPMYSALITGDNNGEFTLYCNGIKGYWYFQTIEIGGGKYYDIVGVQESIITKLVNLNYLYTPLVFVAIILLVFINTTLYLFMKTWRGKNSRTRASDRE